MLYKFLGVLVWNGAKTLLRAKYGRTYLPARVLMGAVVLAGAVVGIVFAKRDSE
jgi:ABC-type enterochelin transport system permease subunit